MEDSNSILVFYVNGKEVIEKNADPEVTLLYYIRRKLGLTGTKLGCGEGGCGACTVMLSKYDTTADIIRHYSVNACLFPLCCVHGLAVTTVEGIGSTRTKLHPCQERIAKAHGSQCGFCTPGFVMSMYTLLRNNKDPTQLEMEHAFEGNLCRCTGYRPILAGYKTFCSDCPCNGCGLFDSTSFSPLDPTQDPIFPPKLKVNNYHTPLAIRGSRVQWHSPITLDQLLSLKSAKDSRIVVGNTEIGVETKLKNVRTPLLIYPRNIPELNVLRQKDESVIIGAAVSLTDVQEYLEELVHTLPSYKVGVLKAILEMLRWFAGPQIRNVSSLASNIITASPISDLNPIMLACRAKLNIASTDGHRTIIIDPSFFTGYRKVKMEANEVVISVEIPFTSENEHVYAFKQARRKDDDIAIVNSCMCVMLDNGDVVQACSIAYGGMSFKTIIAEKTQNAITGKKWNKDLLSLAIQTLSSELLLNPTVPGGMPEYRVCLALSFFYKFYLQVTDKIASSLPRQQSIIKEYHREPTAASQGFQYVSADHTPTNTIDHTPNDTIGQPLMHLSALKQATGEAIYIDDLPYMEREMYAGLVLSERAHATFTIDGSKIDNMEGVYLVTVDDVPGTNVTGIFKDECVFADKKVTAIGQIIALVVAKDQLQAQQAAKLVQVNYSNLPPVLTIEDAIDQQSFHHITRSIKCGDADAALSTSRTLQGEVRVGGQEHFYLETNACIAIPREDQEMELITSTQNVDEAQVFAARALGVASNRIIARVRRLGGGFGGKESRNAPLSTAMAVAARKVGVPVRIMMERHEDMVYSGHRHPFLGRYRVGFTDEGKLTALKVDLYSNCGHSADLSIAVMERAVTHINNAYYIPHVSVNGRCCMTNLPSNTAFRGFGGPQAMRVMEEIMDNIAYTLNIDPVKVREDNFLQDGNTTPYGVTLDNCHISRCWNTLLATSQYYKRREEIEEFNRSNECIKRGIAVIPTKYGIAFSLTSLNQGGALVHVYKDGSVLLTHGGIEIGQGLHTKVLQVCSKCLGIPVDKIYHVDTSSDKVANSSPTAASSSTDLYGAAVQDCCNQIMSCLQPIIDNKPNGSWEEWVMEAYTKRINLSAQGFYKVPDIGYDWDTGRGRPYNYYTYGTACSEVEIDTLTGDFKILRTDILMDVGDSINPAIDIGQVEGAFTQGLGLFTLEECVFLTDGRLLTVGPGQYKIPACSDIPIEFNVSLMDHTPNPRAIFCSKAVGEPPLFLAGSVLYAIKDAIRCYRVEHGQSDVFEIDTPATAERIRMACTDQFTTLVQDSMCNRYPNDHKKRWNITP